MKTYPPETEGQSVKGGQSNWMLSRGDPVRAIWMKKAQKNVAFFSPEVKAIYGVP
jgi:hypothetical protein